MGQVYRGQDVFLGREVAIKALRPEMADDPALLARFRREARTLAELRHTNIVSFHDFFEHDGRFFMVMEYVEGQTFAELIEDHPEGLPWRGAMVLALEILSALEHAHGRGIVHRDIKPANLLLAVDRSVRVLDFGVAQGTKTGKPSVEEILSGTLRYMSPEQMEGEYQDGRSDLYSLALVVFELLSGCHPYAGLDEDALFRAGREGLPHLRPLCPDLPPAVEALIFKALAPGPADRFDSAREFRQLLDAATREASPWGATPQVPAPSVAAKGSARPAEPTLIRMPPR